MSPGLDFTFIRTRLLRPLSRALIVGIIAASSIAVAKSSDHVPSAIVAAAFMGIVASYMAIFWWRMQHRPEALIRDLSHEPEYERKYELATLMVSHDKGSLKGVLAAENSVSRMAAFEEVIKAIQVLDLQTKTEIIGKIEEMREHEINELARQAISGTGLKRKASTKPIVPKAKAD